MPRLPRTAKFYFVEHFVFTIVNCSFRTVWRTSFLRSSCCITTTLFCSSCPCRTASECTEPSFSVSVKNLWTPLVLFKTLEVDLCDCPHVLLHKRWNTWLEPIFRIIEFLFIIFYPLLLLERVACMLTDNRRKFVCKSNFVKISTRTITIITASPS